MRKILSVIALLSVMIFGAHAGPYPVVATMSTQIFPPDGAVYTYTWAVIDIPSADQPAPANWSYVFGHKHYSLNPNTPVKASFPDQPTSYRECINQQCIGRVRTGETLSQTAMRISDNGKALVSGALSHAGRNVDECVGFFFVSRGSDPLNTLWSNVIFPGGSCIIVPPGKDFCEINTPSITLNHGTLSVTDANGSEATEWINMRCTVATKVTLRLASDIDYIPMQNNARAHIKINGKSVGGQYDFPAGDTQLEIKSVLENITQDGDYTGFTVMVIEPA
ncbi:hypothetical protein [Pantoea sp. SOD02]|uniref:MrpH family fimbial adhesin n=1 Tax=Pantoea sp. SOD02 TaxID=2970818 RepID=UPI0021576705|nr:hypothetical protein [Pantoea sp. SOD02]UVC29812.1 hypothetical protein NR302_02190 [Pantoea sp. SOD02]